MTRIEVKLTGTAVSAKLHGALTAGMVGVPVTFSFDSSWDGLSKIAVFRGCTERTRDLVGGNETTVPYEVLVVDRVQLEIGVEGRKPDGTLVYPSVMARVGVVQQGANASADPGADPSPSKYDDIMGHIQKIYDEGVKLAENEIVRIVERQLIENPPAPGYSPSVSVAAIENGYRITVEDKDGSDSFDIFHGQRGPQGPAGPQGPEGQQGPAGPVGPAPIKGKDYYTEEDKAEMVLNTPQTLTEEQKAQARKNTDSLGKSAVHTGYAEPTDAEAKFWVNPNGNVGGTAFDTYYDAFMSSVAGAMSAFLSGTAKKYDTITEALAEGAGKTDGTGKVLGYTSGGKLNIMLLGDMESSETITVAKDCTIHLNGHKLSFTAGKRFTLNAGVVTINGTVPGSEITKNLTNGGQELLIWSNCAELHLIGGTYSSYGTATTGFMAIFSKSKLTMFDCAVKMDVSGSMGYGMTIGADTTVDNCVFDICNHTEHAKSIHANAGEYSTIVRNSTLITKSYVSEAQGIMAMSKSLSLENCKIITAAFAAGADSFGVRAGSGYCELNVTNCHIKADGHSDIGKGSDNDVRSAAAISADSSATVIINGGEYWGAREALSISGESRINGGIFKGCGHGGAYFGGEDIKVKNAIFRNVVYNGECGWDEPNPDGTENWYGGACYCGNATAPTNAWFDNCRFETETDSVNLFVAKCTNTTAYISNSTLEENHGRQLRADAQDIIYVGKNVNGGVYTTYTENGGAVDSETYAGQEFGFETETTADNAILCVKDERGNWVGVC